MNLFAYVLRTHFAPKAAVVLAVLELYNIIDRGMPWRGELVWTIDWSGTVLVLVGPILAGAAAIDAGRFAHAGTGYLTASTQSARRVYFLSFAAAALPAMVVHVAAVLAALVLSSPDSQLSAVPSAVVVLSQLCGIAFYAALGSVCGRFAGSVVGGPVAVILCILLFWQFGTSTAKFSVLMFGRATSSLLGLQYNNVYSLVQVGFLALAALALIAIPVRVVSGRRRPPRTAVLALAVAAIGAPLLAPIIKIERFERVSVAPTSCSGSQPVVCMYPDHERFLPSAEQSLARLHKGAATLGVADLLASHVKERVPGEGPARDGQGRIQIPVDSFRSGELTPFELANDLVVPYHCPELYGDRPPSFQFGENLHRASGTLLAASGYRVDAPPGEGPMSPAELRSVLTAFKSCQIT